MSRRVELGDRVKNIITGHEGIVIGTSEWLNGCRTIGVKAPNKKKGDKPQDSIWSDEPELKVVKRGVVKVQTATPVKPRTGGPRPTPSRERSPGRRR